MARTKCTKNPDRSDGSTEALEKRLQKLIAENAALKKDNAELQSQIRQQNAVTASPPLDENRNRGIIENIREGYFETDLWGRITFCNQALLNIAGYDRKDIIGNNFQKFAPPRTVRSMRRVFGRVYKSGRDSKAVRYDIFHKNGRTLIIEFATALVRNEQGEPIGFRGILRDVSEQVKAADKEKRLQIQLQQAQKMEALGTLAGGLAHGFNNVLMAIQGSLSLISMTLEPGHPMQKHLNRISQSTEKGTRLAREILSFAKVGKFVVMETDLNKILKSTSRMFLRSNPRLKISENYQEDLWPVRVDRVQIGQVLLGLYMHAAEAMPAGGDLFLQSENILLDESYTTPFGNPPGRYIKISVTDSGQGLTEEAKRRIFEPFFSPYRPLRFEALGLAATYGIIKSHGGLINVYSEKGHGATFNIYFPVARMEIADKQLSLQINGGTETILMVDDDATASRIGREILERRGYHVMTAESGAEAASIYHEYKENVDLVLLDVILPDLKCDQVYRQLRKINPDVLVLLTSGYNVNRQITSLLKQGCAGFAQKPFQTQSLSGKVRAALDGKRLSPSGE